MPTQKEPREGTEVGSPAGAATTRDASLVPSLSERIEPSLEVSDLRLSRVLDAVYLDT